MLEASTLVVSTPDKCLPIPVAEWITDTLACPPNFNKDDWLRSLSGGPYHKQQIYVLFGVDCALSARLPVRR